MSYLLFVSCILDTATYLARVGGTLFETEARTIQFEHILDRLQMEIASRQTVTGLAEKYISDWVLRAELLL